VGDSTPTSKTPPETQALSAAPSMMISIKKVTVDLLNMIVLL
jgi:hypothetical protein